MAAKAAVVVRVDPDPKEVVEAVPEATAGQALDLVEGASSFSCRR